MTEQPKLSRQQRRAGVRKDIKAYCKRLARKTDGQLRRALDDTFSRYVGVVSEHDILSALLGKVILDERIDDLTMTCTVGPPTEPKEVLNALQDAVDAMGKYSCFGCGKEFMSSGAVPPPHGGVFCRRCVEKLEVMLAVDDGPIPLGAQS